MDLYMLSGLLAGVITAVKYNAGLITLSPFIIPSPRRDLEFLSSSAS